MDPEERLRKIVSRCTDLSDRDYSHIESLIREYSPECSITTNMNGIFINLKEVSEEAVNRIETYLDSLKGFQENDRAFQEQIHRIQKEKGE